MRSPVSRTSGAARTSAFAFKGRDVDYREIGRSFNVNCRAGGKRSAGGKPAPDDRAVDQSADGYYVWSETYDRGMADIFEVQDELARAITASLKVKLTADTKPPPVNVDAYTKYLQGLHHVNRFTVEGYRQAIEFFQAALLIDPLYPPPHAGIANCYAMLGFDWYAGAAPCEAMPLAKLSATRALQLDESLAKGHMALGQVRMLFEWDWTGAEASFRRAIELNPGLALAYHWLSLFLSTRNRHQESIEAIQRARELDPLSLIINQNLGRAYHLAGQYDQAIEHYHRTLALEPGFFSTQAMLAESLTMLSRDDEALAVLQDAEEVAGPRSLLLMVLAFCSAEWEGWRMAGESSKGSSSFQTVGTSHCIILRWLTTRWATKRLHWIFSRGLTTSGPPCSRGSASMASGIMPEDSQGSNGSWTK